MRDKSVNELKEILSKIKGESYFMRYCQQFMPRRQADSEYGFHDFKEWQYQIGEDKLRIVELNCLEISANKYSVYLNDKLVHEVDVLLDLGKEEADFNDSDYYVERLFALILEYGGRINQMFSTEELDKAPTKVEYTYLAKKLMSAELAEQKLKAIVNWAECKDKDSLFIILSRLLSNIRNGEWFSHEEAKQSIKEYKAIKK